LERRDEEIVRRVDKDEGEMSKEICDGRTGGAESD